MDNPSFSSFANEQMRVVLFPHGPPRTEQLRDECNRMLIFCGADPMRILDQAFAGHNQIDRFLRYISRLDRTEMETAIIVLTKTNPLAMRIIGDRIRLCNKYRELESALWCVFTDTDTDPFVWDNLERSGRIVGDPQEAPIFTDYARMIYLILDAACKNHETIRNHARQIQKNNREKYIVRESPTEREARKRTLRP